MHSGVLVYARPPPFPMLLRDSGNMVRSKLHTEPSSLFSMHTLHEVSMCECALSKLRPRLLHGHNRMRGSWGAVAVNQDGQGQCDGSVLLNDMAFIHQGSTHCTYRVQ